MRNAKGGKKKNKGKKSKLLLIFLEGKKKKKKRKIGKLGNRCLIFASNKRNGKICKEAFVLVFSCGCQPFPCQQLCN